MVAGAVSRGGSSPSASTLHPTSSNEQSQTSNNGNQRSAEKHGKPVTPAAATFDEKDSTKDSDSGYEDRGEHEVDDDGKKKKVKVVLEKRTGKELVTEIGQGPYTQPRW